MTLTMLLLALLPAVAQLPDAGSIMSKSRNLTITGSLSADLSLSIAEKSGSVRNRMFTMTTKSFPDGMEKRFIKFVEPADVRGTAMLIVDNSSSADEMWVYLPALKKTRRIVASEKGRNFMSSEFSNSDLTSPPLSDFINMHLDGSGTGNMWIIESTPLNEAIADDYGFSRKISYIDKESFRITKIEFCNFDNQVFKVLEVKSIHPLPGGKYMIKDMIASNLLNSRKSEIVFNNIRDGVAIDDSFFSVQNLER